MIEIEKPENVPAVQAHQLPLVFEASDVRTEENVTGRMLIGEDDRGRPTAQFRGKGLCGTQLDTSNCSVFACRLNSDGDKLIPAYSCDDFTVWHRDDFPSEPGDDDMNMAAFLYSIPFQQ